nr:transcription activator BRG1-like [Aegilops tauschii subsp. strangulata]
MLLREFLTLRVAPLQARARPLWRLGDEEDKIPLSSEALPDNELSVVLRLLVGDNQEYPPSAFIPLFHCKDWEQIVASRPTFDGRRLVPPAPTGAPVVPKPVDLSSDESRGKEEGEEDSEETPEDMGETSPLILERALSEMAQLREDLRSADPRLVVGRLELASSWLQSNMAVRATLNQAATASEKEKRAAAQAAADREAALKDAKAAHDRCRALEKELKGMRDEHTEEARGRRVKEEEMRAREDAIKNHDAELGELEKTQAAERGRLEELERKVEAEKVDLEAKAKVMAEDRVAFSLLE